MSTIEKTITLTVSVDVPDETEIAGRHLAHPPGNPSYRPVLGFGYTDNKGVRTYRHLVDFWRSDEGLLFGFDLDRDEMRCFKISRIQDLEVVA